MRDEVWVGQIGFIAILLVIGGTITLLNKYSHTDAAPAKKPGIGAAVPSQFKFSGVVGWWQGATDETSMALFHSSPSDGCFTSIEHKTGTVNAAEEVQKTESSLTASGYKVTQVGTQPLILQTNTGPQQYILYQSSITTPTGETTLKGGQEFGYALLPNGYLKIEAYCDTAEALQGTIPALQAIKYTSQATNSKT